MCMCTWVQYRVYTHTEGGANEPEGACSCELQEALLRMCAWDVPRECGV